GQGTLIAIVGENLQGAQEIWFNDQKAVLTPTYITSGSILVSVPSMIPNELTNTFTIVFSNGRRLVHDFQLQISKPVVASMLSEYVPTGELATIRGNYFYEPLSITFAGGVEGEIETVEDNRII